MTSCTVDNVELPHRDHSTPSLGRRSDVSVDHGLRQQDVGWPLLRYGNRSSWSSSLRCEDTPQDGGCVEAMPNNARIESLEDAERSSVSVGRSLDFFAREVEELIERPPPFAFLKPCRQLERQYSSNRKSLAGQLTSLKIRLDRLAIDSSFRHSHDKITVKETTSKEGKEVVHERRHIQGVDEPTEAPTSGHVPRTLDEKCCGISSTQCSLQEKEAPVALNTPAAANFLVETFDAPLYTPGVHNAVAIPFKWEDAPGKAKVDTAARMPDPLQLPPRLAVPSQCSSESRSHELKVPVFSYPLAGIFAPRIAASPPARQQHGPSWMHYQSSKNLQPKQSHPHHGYEGNQDMLSQSGDSCLNERELKKSFSQPVTTAESLNLKPRTRFSSKVQASQPSMQQGSHGQSAAPSSPTTILHASRQSSSSRTYLSCELDAPMPRTAESKTSSTASFESTGEDFDCKENPSPNSCINKPHSFDSHTSAGYSETPTLHSSGKKSHVKLGLLKLCKRHGKSLGKYDSRKRSGPLYSPEVWAPTLATYFQHLDINDQPAISSELLNNQEPPTSSAPRNSKGDSPLAINNCAISISSRSTDYDGDHAGPTGQLPSRIPSVAGLELAGSDPRKAAANLGKISIRSERSHNNLSLTNTPARLQKYRISTTQTSSRDEESLHLSPAYASALQLLSPAANLATSRPRRRSRNLPSSAPKPHRRVQFMLSMCKILKRVFFQQQPRRPDTGTTLQLVCPDEQAPIPCEFSTVQTHSSFRIIFHRKEMHWDTLAK